MVNNHRLPSCWTGCCYVWYVGAHDRPSCCRAAGGYLYMIQQYVTISTDDLIIAAPLMMMGGVIPAGCCGEEVAAGGCVIGQRDRHSIPAIYLASAYGWRY